MLERRGFAEPQWLAREIQPANRDEVIQLGLSPAASARLKRLRLADGIVMAVENSTFPATLIPDPQAIGGSLYSYLEARGTPIVRALQHFRAVNATDEIAEQMGIAPHDALLLITRIGYTSDQRAIELTDTYCRTTTTTSVVELRRSPAAGAPASARPRRYRSGTRASDGGSPTTARPAAPRRACRTATRCARSGRARRYARDRCLQAVRHVAERLQPASRLRERQPHVPASLRARRASAIIAPNAAR